MWDKIRLFSTEKKSWLLFSSFCLFLEMSALFVQYFLKFEPCLICVQQRALILLLMIVSFAGMFFRKSKISIFFILGLMGIIGKIFDLALNKTLLQMNPSVSGFCSIEKPFPNWLPMDKWFPAIFLNQGDCSATDIDILGMSLSENLMLISIILFIILGMVVISKLKKVSN